MKKILIFFIVLIITALLALTAYHFLYTGTTGLTYVTIDINPSVELGLDEDEKVVDVVALNEDADIITSDLNLVGLTVEDATEKVVDAAAETGYIDDLSEENSVLVSCYNDDEATRTNIEQKVINKLNARLDAKKISAVVMAQGLTDALKAEADEYGVPNGKMLLIERAVALDSSLNKSDLATLSVQDIQKKIQAFNQTRIAALKQEIQELKATWQQQKQARVTARVGAIQAKKDQLWNDYQAAVKDADIAKKDQIVNNLIQAKKTKIQEKIQEFKNELKQENKDVDSDNSNYPVIEQRYDQIKQRLKDRATTNNNTGTNTNDNTNDTPTTNDGTEDNQ